MEQLIPQISTTRNSRELLFMQIPSTDLMSKSGRYLNRPNGLKGSTFNESDFRFLKQISTLKGTIYFF